MSYVFYDDGYPEASDYDNNYEWQEVVTPRTRRLRRVVPGQPLRTPVSRRPAHRCGSMRRFLRTMKEMLMT